MRNGFVTVLILHYVQVRDYRPDWELKVNQPVAGNYYPVSFGSTDGNMDLVTFFFLVKHNFFSKALLVNSAVLVGSSNKTRKRLKIVSILPCLIIK